jgi:hypothetical protein
VTPSPGKPRQDNLSHRRFPSTPSALIQTASHLKTTDYPNPRSQKLNPAKAGTTKHTSANAPGAPQQGNHSPKRHPSTPSVSSQITSHPKTRTNSNPMSLQQNSATRGTNKNIGTNAFGTPQQDSLRPLCEESTPLTSVQTTPHLKPRTDSNPASLQLKSKTPGTAKHTGPNANAKVNTSILLYHCYFNNLINCNSADVKANCPKR